MFEELAHRVTRSWFIGEISWVPQCFTLIVSKLLISLIRDHYIEDLHSIAGGDEREHPIFGAVDDVFIHAEVKCHLWLSEIEFFSHRKKRIRLEVTVLGHQSDKPLTCASSHRVCLPYYYILRPQRAGPFRGILHTSHRLYTLRTRRTCGLYKRLVCSSECGRIP